MTDVQDATPATAESATDLFRALQRLRDAGHVTLSYDFARLHHMDCPVAVEADGNRLAYAILALMLLALWLKGWEAAVATLVAGAVFYFSLGRRFVRGRIRRRVEEQALASLDLWQKLWRFGGIGLVTRDGGARCVAPDGNWMALVRQLRASEYVTG